MRRYYLAFMQHRKLEYAASLPGLEEGLQKEIT